MHGVFTNYCDIVYAMYSDALESAVVLRKKIMEFDDGPSPETFEGAKKAWLTARDHYGKIEVTRFFESPIDGKNGVEPLLNAWPIDESYIDYVEETQNPGSSTIRKNFLKSLRSYYAI